MKNLIGSNPVTCLASLLPRLEYAELVFNGSIPLFQSGGAGSNPVFRFWLVNHPKYGEVSKLKTGQQFIITDNRIVDEKYSCDKCHLKGMVRHKLRLPAEETVAGTSDQSLNLFLTTLKK